MAELTSQLAKTKHELATASTKFDDLSKKEANTARYNRDLKRAQKSLDAEVANLKRKVESTETAVATA